MELAAIGGGQAAPVEGVAIWWGHAAPEEGVAIWWGQAEPVEGRGDLVGVTRFVAADAC